MSEYLNVWTSEFSVLGVTFQNWMPFSSNTLRDLDDGPQREVVGAALPEAKKEGPQCHVSATRWIMSALPPKASMCTALAHVCFGLNSGH
jgi:hypothetical protein